MGELKVSADAKSVSLCDRGHRQQDALLFERQPSGSWRQELQLTNELPEAVVIANESTVSRKKPKKAAAESALSRGNRTRGMLVSAYIFSLEPMMICNVTSVCHRLRPPPQIPMDSLLSMRACEEREHAVRLHAVHGIYRSSPPKRRDYA
jgi:hypothetical protein